MRLCLRPNALHGAFPRPNRHPICGHPPWRSLLTLAIETSCDDTSVAVLDVTQVSKTGQTQAELHFHKKITANNAAFNGVHPLVALESHQENLAILVAEAIEHLPRQQLPDFISATRGPGMRSNLFTGLDTAKGLAVAWSKPLIGVHHMQAHALTPRLVAALEARQTAIYLSRNSAQESFIEDFDHISLDPEFPFLSVLASGGHTLLIQSSSLTENKIMGSTSDIAIGECLDKIARTVLPSHVLLRAGNTMYGALLEKFAFPERKSQSKRDDIPPQDTSQNMSYVLENIIASEYVKKNKSSYVYEVPKNNEEALKRNISPWGWGLNQPLTKGAGGLKSNSMEMSFTGLTTAVERLFRYQRDPTTNKLTNVERKPEEISIDERRDLAEYVMRAAFE
jgi:N6-L-threonylcarbamoyladenine synthase